MKYLCLVYVDEKAFYALSEAERESLWTAAERYTLELQSDPAFIAADALQPTWDAATVRVRGGEVIVTDGPFAETREQLAGFLLIDAPHLDAAIAIAQGVPGPPAGITIEIRPVRSLTDHVGSVSGARAAAQ